jgi:hypothetical protein
MKEPWLISAVWIGALAGSILFWVVVVPIAWKALGG